MVEMDFSSNLIQAIPARLSSNRTSGASPSMRHCSEKSILAKYINDSIYIYICLKIKPNSVRIRSLSRQIFVLPSMGFELTPLIHCSTNRLALCPAP